MGLPGLPITISRRGQEFTEEGQVNRVAFEEEGTTYDISKDIGGGLSIVLHFPELGLWGGVVRRVDFKVFRAKPYSAPTVQGVAFWTTRSVTDDLLRAVTRGRKGLARYPADEARYFHPAYMTPKNLSVESFFSGEVNDRVDIYVYGNTADGQLIPELKLPQETASITHLLFENRKHIEEISGLRNFADLLLSEKKGLFELGIDEIKTQLEKGVEISKVLRPPSYGLPSWPGEGYPSGEYRPPAERGPGAGQGMSEDEGVYREMGGLKGEEQ